MNIVFNRIINIFHVRVYSFYCLGCFHELFMFFWIIIKNTTNAVIVWGVQSISNTNKKDVIICLNEAALSDTTIISAVILDTNDKNTPCHLPVVHHDTIDKSELIKGNQLEFYDLWHDNKERIIALVIISHSCWDFHFLFFCLFSLYYRW